MLTRIMPGVGIGNVTEAVHETLDTHTHKLAEDAFAELGYTGKDLTSVIVWTDVGKTLKIREVQLSYTGKDLTGIVVQQFDGGGSAIATLTKTLAYAGKNLASVTTVRT